MITSQFMVGTIDLPIVTTLHILCALMILMTGHKTIRHRSNCTRLEVVNQIKCDVLMNDDNIIWSLDVNILMSKY